MALDDRAHTPLKIYLRAVARRNFYLVAAGRRAASSWRVETYALGALRAAFVANVRRHRHRLGWSQEKLALEAGFNRVYLNGIEAGRRNVSLDNVEKLAVALGVDPLELLLPVRTSAGPVKAPN